MKKACVIGLGYVGLPVAVRLAQAGYSVIGYDIDKRRVLLTNQGKSHIKDEYLSDELPRVKENVHASTDEHVIKDADFVIVCVPTPIDHRQQPDLAPLIHSSEAIARNMKENQLISIESTIAPGTCRGIVKPILEKNGFHCDKDFYLAHCPERIDPGNKQYKLADLPRVLGATSDGGLEKALAFYESFITAPITKVSTIETAEMIKITENTFRDVNIAFVNELACSIDTMGLEIDIMEVIDGAATKPFGFKPHYPGTGVGGHCIAVDPWYLIQKGQDAGYPYHFLRLTREINDRMPLYTVNKVIEGLNDCSKAIKGTKITVLGVAYKKNIDDSRESPSHRVIKELYALGADMIVYDPFIPEKSTVGNLEAALQSECIVVCTDHDQFKLYIDAKKLKEAGVKVVIDGRNCLDKKSILASGIIYKGIGR